MASTLSLYAALKGVIGSQKINFPPDGLFSPANLTTSADILLTGRKVVATSSVTELISVGSGADIASAIAFIFIPSGACRISWRSTASDADNSVVSCLAGVPLIIPGHQTLPYAATSSDRIDGSLANISSFSCWQNTGSNIFCSFAAIG